MTPPMAEPSGRPDMLKLIETASTRPNHPRIGVRRCRSESTPTSTGPSTKPTRTRPIARPTRPKLALTGRDCDCRGERTDRDELPLAVDGTKMSGEERAEAACEASRGPQAAHHCVRTSTRSQFLHHPPREWRPRECPSSPGTRHRRWRDHGETCAARSRSRRPRRLRSKAQSMRRGHWTCGV